VEEVGKGVKQREGQVSSKGEKIYQVQTVVQLSDCRLSGNTAGHTRNSRSWSVVGSSTHKPQSDFSLSNPRSHSLHHRETPTNYPATPKWC